jgi:hypothetical protein
VERNSAGSRVRPATLFEKRKLAPPDPCAPFCEGTASEADNVNAKKVKPDKFVMVAHATLEDKYFKALPESAKTLFLYLCKCRNRLGNPEDDFSFWRTDQQLITDTGFSRNQLKRSRKALIGGQFIWWASYLPEGKSKGPRYIIMDTLFEEIPVPDWHYITVSKTDTQHRPKRTPY